MRIKVFDFSVKSFRFPRTFIYGLGLENGYEAMIYSFGLFEKFFNCIVDSSFFSFEGECLFFLIDQISVPKIVVPVD